MTQADRDAVLAAVVTIKEKLPFLMDLTSKYESLNLLDVDSIEWRTIEPYTPDYLFVQQDSGVKSEYSKGWQIAKIFPVNTLGFQSHRDHFAIEFNREQLQQRLQEFRDTRFSDEEIKSKYDLTDNRDWSFAKAR